MWVWSDELADQFPAISPMTEPGAPLVAYAVEQGTDLEALARAVLLASGKEDRAVSHSGGVMAHER